MRTGAAPRSGAVLGRALGPAVVFAAAVTGCGSGGSGDSGAGAAPPPSSASPSAYASRSPSPSATPPAELCARIVAHWSRAVLDTGTYGDYQSMGLSNGQYEILRGIVDAARAERDREGRAAAEGLIDRRAHERCEERYRGGGPTGGAWQ
ncbi:hypothetical protein [Streptomyces sp. GC420]|uniref:hypothetical protein n=1 Tax=Streptomyces sp. GC420 TaxID=2697568 RepID=UPI001415247F|nr:hypothetical protein [Streptomyces sp. GC420]NBM16815.1 hypothetical protein [Streptomyces sp. GC420]